MLILYQRRDLCPAEADSDIFCDRACDRVSCSKELVESVVISACHYIMSASSEATVDAIVKTYLLSRGYDKAAAQMDIECNRATDAPVLDSGRTPTNVSENAGIGISTSSSFVPDVSCHVIGASEGKKQLLANHVLSTVTEDIVLFSINDGNYSIYDEEYNALRSWCLTSLDIVKSELLLILMPSFVHW